MIQTSQLPNNIRIVTDSVSDVNKVYISFAMLTGSQDEPREYGGLCHVLEHSLFLGTEKKTEKEISQISKWLGGNLNAETNQDKTRLTVSVLSEDVETAFELMSDMIQNPIFPEESVEKEKQVILTEISDIQEDDEILADNLILNAAFKQQPMGLPTEGTPKKVKSITAGILKAFHKKNYSSDKLIVTAVGGITHEQCVVLAHQYLGSFSPQQKTEKTSSQYLGGDRRVMADSPETNVFRLGFEGCAIQDLKSFITADILSTIYEDSLFDTLRQDQGLLYTIKANNDAFQDTGVFIISGYCTPENTPAVIRSCVEQIVQSDKLITLEALKISQKKLKLDLSSNDGSMEERVFSHEFDMQYFGRIISLKEYTDVINSITVSDVKQLAKKIFKSRLSFAGYGSSKHLPSYQQITDWMEEARQNDGKLKVQTLIKKQRKIK